MSQQRQPLDGAALAVMFALAALWGVQQVAVKWIAARLSPVMQAALRSIIATGCSSPANSYSFTRAWLFRGERAPRPATVVRRAGGLSEPVSRTFLGAALLVAAGIVLVNLRR